MKKLINEPGSVLDEMLAGIVAASPQLALLDDHRVILRADYKSVRDEGQVALISGGGSGHEPAHAGYVGSGMLTAAVCGEVFTSPSTDAVLAAIRAVTGSAGTLLIVKNYTGDRLNFGLAAEIARSEGLDVQMIVIGDDAALRDTDGAGRRGIAGTVLVHKVAGAAAAAGFTLARVRKVAAEAAESISTMGVALRPCTVPGSERSNFELTEEEVEFGLGIHGETGRSRERVGSARSIVERLCSTIFEDLALKTGDRVGLMVNNLGATPPMELSIVAQEAIAMAQQGRLTVERLWVGTFLTALDMAGCSITAIKLSDTLSEALDAPCGAAAWPGPGLAAGKTLRVASPPPPPDSRSKTPARPLPGARLVLEAAANALLEAEPHLTDLDRRAGDGDLGVNLARGAKAIAAAADNLAAGSPAQMLQDLSALVRREVGGTSGALYSAGLLRAAVALEGVSNPSPSDWAAALDEATSAISTIGDARIGDRTMLDALIPAASVFRETLATSSLTATLKAAIAAGEEGARKTETIAARRGRASYIGDRALGTRDPGAQAVVVLLEAIAGALKGNLAER